MLITVGEDSQIVRTHPYFEYYDFLENPDLIYDVLEDFKPYENYEATIDFYDYLYWLNTSNESIFASTDCAFRIETTQQNPNYSQYCRGRVMVWYKNTEQWQQNFKFNFDRNCFEFLINNFGHYFGLINDPDNLIKVHFGLYPITLQDINNTAWQLMIEFVVYGNTEEETMANFGEFVNHLSEITNNARTYAVEKIFNKNKE